MGVTMPTFEIPDGPTTVELKRSGDGPATGSAVFNVTNKTGDGCDARLSVVPSGQSKAEWFAIDGERERTFAPGETQTAAVKVTVPQDASAGDYPFRLRAVAVNDPDNDHAEGPVATVKVPPPAVAGPPSGPKYWLWILIGLLILAAIGAAAYFAFRPKSDTPGPAPAGNYATFLTGQAGFDDGGGGFMWAGSGPRDRIVHIDFPKAFEAKPTVVVGLTGLDAASQNASSVRLNVGVQNVTERGFDVKFTTWADSRFWSAHVTWIAYKP